MGERKVARYGAALLTLLQDYKKASETTKKSVGSHGISFALFQAGRSVTEVAARRGLSPSTIESHLLRCGKEGKQRLIIPGYEALILEKAKRISTDRLKPLKEALPEEVDYLSIRAVLQKHRLYPSVKKKI